MGHLGLPNGRKQEKFSLKPVIPILEDLMGKKIDFLNDCVGNEIEDKCNQVKDGGLILLENLRFHPEEEGIVVNANGDKVIPLKLILKVI